MIGGTPVLYVRHSALDAVEADNIDQLGEVWSSFRGAKKSLNQGARLEYLSWRLYTRGILQKRRAKEKSEVPLLVEPPGLEMSSSTESINRGFSSQRVVDLFDRICTYPATPVGTLKPPSTFLPRDLVSNPEAMQIPPVPVEPAPEPEKRPVMGIQRRSDPAVCRFDQVSVNDRSYVSLNQPEIALLETLSGRATPANEPTKTSGTTGTPRKHYRSTGAVGGTGMFFIESSSDSEPDQDKDIKIPIPTPLRPGIVRRKTVTFEEPKEPKEPKVLKDDPKQEDSDDYEDIDDESEEEAAGDSTAGDSAHSDSNWGDSDWDDFSEDDEPMFSARVVPPKLQQRRSLLSSMFAGSSTSINRTSTPDQPDHLVPSPQSEPRTSNFKVGSAPYLGRVASQSSLFESAMHNSGNALENILLNNNLQSHIPIMQIPGSHPRATSIPSDEVMERELSQSIRTDLSHKRQYDLDVLWRSQRAETPASQRRPTLSRSTTMPVTMPMGSYETTDLQDPQSYHARGW